MLGAGTAFAGAFARLMRAELALKHATSWHLTEPMPDGKTLSMDYSAPNCWRIKSAPNITELIIGTNVYRVNAGRVMQLPPTYGAMIARTVHIHMFTGAERAARCALSERRASMDSRCTSIGTCAAEQPKRGTSTARASPCAR
jgi:hypothetical protein